MVYRFEGRSYGARRRCLSAESIGANIMLGISEFYLVQEDGGLPTTLAAGSAPGESGVAFLSERFHRGAHLSATLRRHLICFMSPLRIDCRIATGTLGQKPPDGPLALCPLVPDGPDDAYESDDAHL